MMEFFVLWLLTPFGSARSGSIHRDLRCVSGLHVSPKERVEKDLGMLQPSGTKQMRAALFELTTAFQAGNKAAAFQALRVDSTSNALKLRV